MLKNAVFPYLKDVWRAKKRIGVLVISDIILILLSTSLSLLLRFDFVRIPGNFLASVRYYILINTALTVVIFIFSRLYKSIWQFAGLTELLNIATACVLSGAQMFIGTYILRLPLPNSYFVIYTGMLFVSVSALRMLFPIYRRARHNGATTGTVKRIMMVGAGDAGNIILRELMNSTFVNGKVVCIVDDDPRKQGGYLRGVKVYGGRDMIPKLVKKMAVDQIYITMPSAVKREIGKIVDICNDTGCEIRILPDICRFVKQEDISVMNMRNVNVKDLLGREQISVSLNEINEYITDKVVLVTGGGGSIGSELCEQIAAHKPKLLLLVDIYENNAYETQQELLRMNPQLPLHVLIGSVRDKKRMNYIFETYHPDIVYHAAAHKHVPLMEDSPSESIKNNVFGTYNMAMAAGEYGAARFVLISTDKAVNPTNIMGASKRICEMIMQYMNNHYNTEYIAVRFGNVLGSNGSVIPLFKKQIEKGGPVTVTHKDIIRYFMTISEAVSLVLQAGAYAKGGEIFVLDMGEPVKIDDLARNLIRLSGFIPDVDIPIEYTGLRPGEKLYEELLMQEEGMRSTENKLIFIGRQIEFDETVFMRQLDELRLLVEDEGGDVKHKVQEIIGTYQIPEVQNEQKTRAGETREAPVCGSVVSA